MKKILSLAMAITLVATLFVGCKQNNNNSSSQNSSSTAESKNYTVATNAQFAPFESMDGNKMVGLDVDLVNAIASKKGFTVTMKDMAFDSVLSSVQTGSCDFAISGLTVTADRQKNNDFSTPYYVSHQIVIVRTGDKMIGDTTADKVNADLVGRKIAACTGFTGLDYVKGGNGYPGIKDAKVKQYDNIYLAIQDLKNKQVDAVVMDNVPAIQAASIANNKDAVKVINVPLTDEQYAIAVKKGDTELKTKIDDAISTMKNDGSLDELIQKWIANSAGSDSSTAASSK